MAHDPTTRVPVDEHEDHVHDGDHGYERPAGTVEHGHDVAPAHTYSVIGPFTALTSVIFGALQVLLVIRFILKLGGALETHPLVAAVYGLTEPLVRPFQGIFPQPQGPPVLEVATLLAIVFLVLVHALILALVRALTAR